MVAIPAPARQNLPLNSPIIEKLANNVGNVMPIYIAQP
jgi:hypothetical protein